MIRDVTDLEVYNLALELLTPTYKLANLIPQDHRKLKYQLIDAAEKIAPIIAEGFGKKKAPREFCRFLSMALGSSDEIITHIRQVKIVGQSYQRISIEDCDDLIAKYKILSKRTNKLLSSWQRFS
jgi:four helix bundle protein